MSLGEFYLVNKKLSRDAMGVFTIKGEAAKRRIFLNNIYVICLKVNNNTFFTISDWSFVELISAIVLLMRSFKCL